MAVDLGVPGVGPGLRVGAGGFRTVFRAEQFGFGRAVAAKILNAVVEQDVELRRFERERQALGSVADQPNIVSVFGWGLTNHRRPYLVMEYLPAGTLATLLKQGPVAAEIAVSITAKLARALAVAQERGVLHRPADHRQPRRGPRTRRNHPPQTANAHTRRMEAALLARPW